MSISITTICIQEDPNDPDYEELQKQLQREGPWIAGVECKWLDSLSFSSRGQTEEEAREKVIRILRHTYREIGRFLASLGNM